VGEDVVLRTEGLSVSYGGVRALSDFTLSVNPGQLVGLIGPNGAGKTTFIDAVTGFARSTGVIELDGTDISRMSPDKRARRGLARTWQSIDLFDELTVRENLTVASSRQSVWESTLEVLTGRNAEAESVAKALALLELDRFAEERPDGLTQGQRKLVGVARALVADPRVICLDEPAAGLDTSESEALGQRLREVVQSGTPMLLVDHDMGLVLSVCDYVYVLDFGKMIAEGTADAVRKNPRVIEAYLGSASSEVAAEVAEA
jgi:branched-chain amino acid transport system ATP-binding protein